MPASQRSETRRRSRPSMRGSPISIGGSWPSSTIERSLSAGPAAREIRAAEVVTSNFVARSLRAPRGGSFVPSPLRQRNAPAGASRLKPWLLCGGWAVAAADRANYPQANRRAGLDMRTFCKNSLTPATRTHIPTRLTAAALWRPARRRDFGTISRCAPPCWEAGAGRFRSSRLRRSRRNSGQRGERGGVRLRRLQRGSSGGAQAFPSLFDNCIGRKRDVGGGVLAGLCCLGWFGASWTDAYDGVRRDY